MEDNMSVKLNTTNQTEKDTAAEKKAPEKEADDQVVTTQAKFNGAKNAMEMGYKYDLLTVNC